MEELKQPRSYRLSTRIWYGGYSAYTICYFGERWYSCPSDSEWMVPGTEEFYDC
jgi:hypothetical protein